MSESIVSNVTSIKCVPFNGTNFAIWKWKVKALLMSMNVWEVIALSEDDFLTTTGEAIKSKLLAAAGEDPDIDVIHAQSRSQAISQRNLKNLKAYSTLVLSMDESVAHLIINCDEDAKEVWSHLLSHYERKTMASKLALKQKFIAMKLVDGESFAEYSENIRQIAGQLKSMGSPPTEDDLLATLLHGLPSSYEGIKDIIINTAQNVTFDQAVEKLADHALQNTIAQGKSEGAFLTRDKIKKCTYCKRNGHNEKQCFKKKSVKKPSSRGTGGSSGGGAPKRSDTRKCYLCDELGHVRSDCPLLAQLKAMKVSSSPKKEAVGMAVTSTLPADPITCYSDDDVILMVKSGSGTFEADAWYMDSGATCHMCKDIDYFIKFTSRSKTVADVAKNGVTLTGYGRGTVALKVQVAGKWVRMILHDVLYVPENLPANLISVSTLTTSPRRSVNVNFHGSTCEVIDNKAGTTLLTCKLDGAATTNVGRKLFKLVNHMRPNADAAFVATTATDDDEEYNHFSIETAAASAPVSDAPPAPPAPAPAYEMGEHEPVLHDPLSPAEQLLELWHRRMGHVGIRNLELLSKGGFATGMTKLPLSGATLKFCEACVGGKQKKKSLKRPSKTRMSRPIEMLHSDIIVVNEPTRGGARYVLIVVDDYSRYVFAVLLKRKSDALAALQSLFKSLMTQHASRIRVFRCDHGGEFTSNKMKAYLQSEGIEQQFSNVDRAAQNGVAERWGRTVLNC